MSKCCETRRGRQSSVLPEGFLTEVVTNDSGSALAQGEVVRMSDNDTVTRSQADTALNAQGTVGVALGLIADGAAGSIVTEGKTTVLLENGLAAVVAGDTLWVSPNVAGRATNVKPAAAQEVILCVGIVKDQSLYQATDTVIADVDVDCEPQQGGLVADFQCGREALAAAVTQAVVFPLAFPVGSQPSVVLTPEAEGGTTTTANHENITNVGFDIRMAAAYTGTVHWVACVD